MADEVQRTSSPMLKGVATAADIQRLDDLLAKFKTEVAAIRADVIPIGRADLFTNRNFLDLVAQFNEYQAKYGYEAKDWDFDTNPQFAALENRVDVLEKIAKDMQAEVTAIKGLLNPAPTP
ncbi:hypothetical protein D3C76_903700 [compost metagenome]